MKSIEQLVRKNILNLKPYTSARDIYQDGIFLDANENSFGSVIESDIVDLNRYPDPHQKELRKTLSEAISISSDKIFFGVGSDEIIDLSIRIFCEPGKSNVIIPIPTYGMYQVACAVNDVEVKSVNLDENFDLNLEKTLNAIDRNTKMIFLCSPNNPTGNLLSAERIKSLAKSFEGIIFIDEAYIDFSEENSFINQISDFNNVIISRTFSKAWGLAGVRCGYCIADDFVISLLFKIKAPYTINKLTSSAVREAIQNSKRKNLFVKNIIEERERLIIELSKLNFVKKIFPSAANFLLVEMNNAKFVFDYLNDKKIRVRMRSDDERLKNCLRITVGNQDENELLIKTLRELN
ncbi:MAG: histidinol-phosphate transaminase [Ignavibacterium sp.]|jgi:histidinol-phosphate aminotransferase|uniref:histidinol-phosphate transaminase n=1 Tax=Ignavibacterium sp. TaxID=2651167 RepID=UPI003296F1D3